MDSHVILPKPWSAQFSKRRNFVYYFNSHTGQSVWSPPVGSVIGGVVVTKNEETSHPEQETLGTMSSPPSAEKAPLEHTTPPYLEDSFSAPCSRTVVAPETSDVIPPSVSLKDLGSEIVSSSNTRKRASDEQYHHVPSKLKFCDKTEASGSSEIPVGHTDSQRKRDTTPAATRLKKLQNLLHEIQQKKNSGNGSSSKLPRASSSPDKASNSCTSADRKRCSVAEDPAWKRRRVDQQGAGGSGKSAVASADVQPSCVVTSTTKGIRTGWNDATDATNENGPESPKPGEKLPYLDSDSDAKVPSPRKAVSSALPVPSAAWSNSHRKEHVRKEISDSEIIPIISDFAHPVQSISGNVKGTCKIGESPFLFPKRKLFVNEQTDVSGTSIASVRVSVQNRHSLNTTDKGRPTRQVNPACRTEGTAVKQSFADEPSSEKDTADSDVSVQSRLDNASSEKDSSQSNVTRSSKEKQYVTPVKQLLPEVPITRSMPNARVSVQSRLIIAASSIVDSQSDKSESGRLSDKKRVDVNSTYSDRFSIHGRLDSSASDRVSLANTESTPVTTSRMCALRSETGVAGNSSAHGRRPELSDVNLSAITKFRERISSLPPDKLADNSSYVSTANAHEEAKSSQPVLDIFNRSADCGRVGNVWEPTVRHSTGYDSPPLRTVDANNAEEENMEVDFPMAPLEIINNSQKNNLFAMSIVEAVNGQGNDFVNVADVASVGPFANEETPTTSSKHVTDENIKLWLQQCVPSSPVRTNNFFLTEESTDEEETDEAMEWDDIQDDLSKVVSEMPKKSANAGEWFIVVDTNILVHHLGVVEELRDTPFPNLGLPVLVIPWLVLQELDSLKAHRIQYNSKDVTVCDKARWAVQFLNSNLKRCHPRVRGQTAADSKVEHYKRQGADDGILQCCLQLKEKGNFVIILTNDKNLANKAIVSGISSFSHDEIMAKLHELDSQHQSPNSQKHLKETAQSGSQPAARAHVSEQDDLERTKVDLVFCHMKLLLKDLLTEVLTSGMKKNYGQMWQSRTIRKPPWTLSDVVHCILKHWEVMREHEFQQKAWNTQDDKLKSCAKDVKKYMTKLHTFLKNSSQKCCNYSSSDMKNILNWSIDVCIGMTAVSFKEKVIETINKLEVLREVCKEKSRGTVMNMLSEIQISAFNSAEDSPAVKTKKAQLKYVRDKFVGVWELMSGVIGSLCDALKLKHNITYSSTYHFENTQAIQEKTKHIYPHLQEMNNCFQKLEITPVQELSENHKLVTDIYFNMKNMCPNSEQDVDDTLSPQLVYIYLVEPKERGKIFQMKEAFESLEEHLMKGISKVIETEKHRFCRHHKSSRCSYCRKI